MYCNILQCGCTHKDERSCVECNRDLSTEALRLIDEFGYCEKCNLILRKDCISRHSKKCFVIYLYLDVEPTDPKHKFKLDADSKCECCDKNMGFLNWENINGCNACKVDLCPTCVDDHKLRVENMVKYNREMFVCPTIDAYTGKKCKGIALQKTYCCNQLICGSCNIDLSYNEIECPYFKKFPHDE